MPKVQKKFNKLNIKERIEDNVCDLSLSELSEVPVRKINQFKRVTILDLSSNKLTTLGEQFVMLNTLVKIDLSKNQIVELPENFGELHSLRHLDLYDNKLQHLPLSFGHLTNLRYLDLKGNPLKPALAKIVGYCLTTDECQMSARKTVRCFQQMRADMVLPKDPEHETQTENSESTTNNDDKCSSSDQQSKSSKKSKSRKKKLLNKTDNNNDADPLDVTLTSGAVDCDDVIVADPTKYIRKEKAGNGDEESDDFDGDDDNSDKIPLMPPVLGAGTAQKAGKKKRSTVRATTGDTAAVDGNALRITSPKRASRRQAQRNDAAVVGANTAALSSIFFFFLLLAINVAVIYVVMFKNPELAEWLIEYIPPQYRNWIVTKTELFRLRVGDLISEFRTPPEEH